MAPIMTKIGTKTPAKPRIPLAERTSSTAALAASPLTPQPSTRRVPWCATRRRFSCETVMKLAAPAPKYQPNWSAGMPKYWM